MATAVPDPLSGAGSDLHARSQTVQRLGNVGNLAVFQFLALDDGDGPRERLLLGRTVSDDDHVVNGMRALCQRDIEERFSRDVHALRGIADERHGQRTVGGSLNRKAAVGIGGCSDRGTLYEYSSAGDRLTVRTFDCTEDSFILCQGQCTCTQNDHK